MKKTEIKLPISANENEPFKVPAHYFDSLPGRIQDRISSSQKVKISSDPILKLFTKKVVWIPSFATLLIIFALILFNPVKKSAIETLSKADTTLTNTIDINNSYALEAQYIERAETMDHINNMSTDSLKKEVRSLPEDIKKEDIVNYLKEEGVDPLLLADL